MHCLPGEIKKPVGTAQAVGIFPSSHSQRDIYLPAELQKLFQHLDLNRSKTGVAVQDHCTVS